MKLTVVAAMLGLMLPCITDAQDVRLEFGTTLNATLSDTLDARKSKPGDSVRAKASEDLKVSGITVIPRGTKLVGQVTEAQSGDAARLGFVFDRADLKDGRKIPLHTTFYALAAAEGAADEPAPPAGGGFGGPVGNLARPAADDSSALDAGGGRNKVDLKPSPGAIGGLNSSGVLYASSRGVFGLEGISLEPNTVPSQGSTVIVAKARTIRLVSGTRLLLSVDSTK